MPADGVVTGCATIDGRLIHLASQDFTVAGGAAGEVHSDKIADMMRMSLKTGSPFVFINDSGGARVQEGIDSLAGYGRVFYNNVMLSGTVPQISLICGPCAGGAAYSPALTDFIIQTQQAQMFITGPQVIKQVTGEVVTAEALGGPQAQMNRSGVVHFVAQNDDEALQLCRRLLSFMPSNNLEDPAAHASDLPLESDAEMNAIVPVDTKVAYDVRSGNCASGGLPGFSRDSAWIRAEHCDRLWAAAGPPGRHRGQPAQCAGGRARYRCVRQGGALCALLQRVQHSVADVCGCAGISARRGAGARRHHPPRRQAAVRLFRGHRPQDHVVLRKAYGGAYIAMCCKDLGADRVVAWPTAEIAVMGAEGAAEIVFRREIDAAQDQGRAPQGTGRGVSRDLCESLCCRRAAAGGRHHRACRDPEYLALALESLHAKRELRPPKKHGLIPL